MSRHLINVRLDETQARKVRVLRERGVVLSELVRAAIDERYARVVDADEPDDVRSVIAGLFAAHPDEATHRPRTYDVHDRRAAAAAAVRAATARKRA